MIMVIGEGGGGVVMESGRTDSCCLTGVVVYGNEDVVWKVCMKLVDK